jgi:hypothetical protein
MAPRKRRDLKLNPKRRLWRGQEWKWESAPEFETIVGARMPHRGRRDSRISATLLSRICFALEPSSPLKRAYSQTTRLWMPSGRRITISPHCINRAKTLLPSCTFVLSSGLIAAHNSCSLYSAPMSSQWRPRIEQPGRLGYHARWCMNQTCAKECLHCRNKKNRVRV